MKLKFLSMALIAMMAVSCGGKNNENEAETTEEDVVATVIDTLDQGGSETTMEVTESSTSSSSASSADIDAWLDKYERLMNTYVSLAKKAKAGDMSAVTEYASYAEQLNELYSDLENVSGNMTPAQTSRLARIYAKMASAAY